MLREILPLSRATARQTLLWPLLLWLPGIVVAFYPTFRSHFRLVQGGLGDSRLVNFTLEHSYRWLMNMPLGDSLWSPPIFFPIENVATYTDLMIGAAPFYWVWRWIGSDPHSAFQLWMLSCWTLNFASCYLLFRYGLSFSAFGAAVGAHLFAFGNPQYSSLAHQQLGPLFWLVLSLAGLIMFLRTPEDSSHVRPWVACSAFWGGLVAQLHTAVYTLAFFVLGLAFVTVIALAIGGTRRNLFSLLRKHFVPVVAVTLIAIGMAAPITHRYRRTAAEIGMHKQKQVHLPRPVGWFLPGEGNRLYGKWQRNSGLTAYRGQAQTSGFGPVTVVACLVGLWIGRRRPEVRWISVGFAGLVILTLAFPGGWSPWWFVREMIPGTAALRAVSRVGLMALFPASLGLAILLERCATRGRLLTAAILTLVIFIEQPQKRPKFDKAAALERVETIVSKVPQDATTFLVIVEGPSWERYVHDDAAWAALSTGIPTVNGRYGHFPRSYPFRKPWAHTAEERDALRADLDSWLKRNSIDTQNTPMITMGANPLR